MSLDVFERQSHLFSLDSPTGAECITCPRKKVCTHLCWAANVLAQKPQDAVNGPLRVVRSSVLFLQIILIPPIASHYSVHQSISKVILSACTERNRTGIIFLFYI